MGPQFHETIRGAKFFDHQLPALIKALNRVADEMEKNRLTDKKEEGRNSEGEESDGQ